MTDPKTPREDPKPNPAEHEKDPPNREPMKREPPREPVPKVDPPAGTQTPITDPKP